MDTKSRVTWTSPPTAWSKESLCTTVQPVLPSIRHLPVPPDAASWPTAFISKAVQQDVRKLTEVELCAGQGCPKDCVRHRTGQWPRMDLLQRSLALKGSTGFWARTWAVPEHCGHLDGPSRTRHRLVHIPKPDFSSAFKPAACTLSWRSFRNEVYWKKLGPKKLPTVTWRASGWLSLSQRASLPRPSPHWEPRVSTHRGLRVTATGRQPRKCLQTAPTSEEPPTPGLRPPRWSAPSPSWAHGWLTTPL